MVGKCYNFFTSKQANTYLSNIDVSKNSRLLDSICEGSNAITLVHVWFVGV
jgi:uncharacterized protein with NRDE domain